MKIESRVNYAHLLFGWCKKKRNWLVAALYFVGAHWYDGICYMVSNAFSYPKALLIMYGFLFSLSSLLIPLHYLVKKYFSWDMLGLDEVNELRNREDIPRHQIVKRAMRWALRKGRRETFFVGSILIGPPIITPILRKKGNLGSSIFYLTTGTFVSVIFWVTLWSGVGLFTWEQYVKPLWNKIF